MKITLLILLYIFQHTHSRQPANCAEAGEILEWPVTDAKCRAARPLNGECCSCEDGKWCEGCEATRCPPTHYPTLNPTKLPTTNPSQDPTLNPAPWPTPYPSLTPSVDPTPWPTPNPTAFPTLYPTSNPSLTPTLYPTYTPTLKPTVNKIKCLQIKTGYIQSAQTVQFQLFISGNNLNVNINTCNQYTTVNTTLTLYDKSLTQIAFDSDGCNNKFGGSQLIINPMIRGTYILKLETAMEKLTGLYKLSVLCNTITTFKPTSAPTSGPTDMPTIVPTNIPTTMPTNIPTTIPTNIPTTITTNMPTTIPTNIPTTIIPTLEPTGIPTLYPSNIPTFTPTDGCQECVYNVKLSGINDITIEECKTITTTPSPTSPSIQYKYNHKTKSPTVRLTTLKPTAKPKKSYWQKRHERDDSSSGNSNKYRSKHKRKSSYDSDSDSRRRLRHKSWNSEKNTEETGNKWIAERNCIDIDSTTDGINGFAQYYKNKCDIEDYDYNENKYSERYISWNKRTDKSDEFITEVCMKYSIDLISKKVANCDESRNVFLGICENDSIDFDLGSLDENDLTNLITSITNINNNVISATGTKINDKLGILVTFESEYVVTEFELCLGNVIVDSQFNKKKTMIKTGKGLMKWNDKYKCNVDGLPCLNFFFDVPCPLPEYIIKKDCNCNKGIKSLSIVYNPNNGLNASISVYLNPRRTDTVLCVFENISPGQQIQCESKPYRKFHKKTYFVVSYIGNSNNCVGKFDTSCNGIKIGDISNGCNDLHIVSYVDGYGSFCDKNVLNEDNTINGANALVNNKPNRQFSFNEFDETHAYILYSLIGVIIIFIVVMIIGFCVCMIKKDENVNGKGSVKYNLTANNMHFEYNNQIAIVNDDCSDTEYCGRNICV